MVLDSRRAGRIAFVLTALACALVALIDLVAEREAHFSAESWFNFHGFYGFVSCVLLVLAAKELRRLLMRDEDYYDR